MKQRGTNTFTIQQVDVTTGEVRWRSEPLGEVNVSLVERDGPGLAIIPNQGVLVGWQDGENSETARVQLFNASDGKVGWELNQTLLIGHVPQIERANNRALITVSDVVIVADVRTGAVQWRIGK